MNDSSSSSSPRSSSKFSSSSSSIPFEKHGPGHSSDTIDLPSASIARILKSCLPSTVSVSKEVKQSFARAAGLFVFYLTHTANEYCVSSSRSTVTADDILAALEEMELEPILQPVYEFLKEYRNKNGDKRRKRGKEKSSGLGENTNEMQADGGGDENKFSNKTRKSGRGRRPALNLIRNNPVTSTSANTSADAAHGNGNQHQRHEGDDENGRVGEDGGDGGGGGGGGSSLPSSSHGSDMESEGEEDEIRRRQGTGSDSEGEGDEGDHDGEEEDQHGGSNSKKRKSSSPDRRDVDEDEDEEQDDQADEDEEGLEAAEELEPPEPEDEGDENRMMEGDDGGGDH